MTNYSYHKQAWAPLKVYGNGQNAAGMLLTPDGARKADEKVQEAGQYMLIHYGVVIDLIESRMIDLQQKMMARKNEYRYNKKYCYGVAWKKLQDIKALIIASSRSIHKENEILLLDTFDCIEKRIDLSLLYWPIVNYLNKEKADDAEYQADYEVVLTMINFGILLLNAIKKQTIENAGVKMAADVFANYDLHGVWQWWSKLCEDVLAYDQDFREKMLKSEDIARMLKIIQDRLTSGYWIEQAFNDLSEIHPEAIKKGHITLD